MKMGLLKKINRAGRREAVYAKQWMRHLIKQNELKKKIQLLNIMDLANESVDKAETEDTQ